MCEAKAFPSDQYALQSQVKFHGYSIDDALIEIAPREGEYEVRHEDIYKAIEDNKKKALESGNKLTQTLNKDGNLVSVKDMNTQEMQLLSQTSSNVTSADIRRELFEGDNVVTGLDTDHGLSDLTFDVSGKTDN